MSRFKTTTINTNNVGSWVERRRKGRMIRKQHTVTGAWSGWMIDGSARRVSAAVKVAQEFVAETMGKMTVAELRTLAGNRGIKVPSKARKADVINALTEV